LKLTANDIRAEGNLISPQAISCYCTMKTDLKAELERLSLAKLIAEFTRELSLQYLIPVDLSDGGRLYSKPHCAQWLSEPRGRAISFPCFIT
jgi:hypothetical protein